MTAKHPNIHFTSEIEDQNSFSFLDIKIIRNTEKMALKYQFIMFLLTSRVLLL